MRTHLGLILTCFLIVSMGLAQGLDTRREMSVRGEISWDGVLAGPLTVELVGVGGGPSEKSLVEGDGSFRIQNAPMGTYQLRVVGPGGAILHEELVSVDGARLLSIHIPSAANDNRSAAGGTISVRQLSHKIPPQAQKAYEKGKQAAAKGNPAQAAESFRRAIAIDPEFVDGFNDLGAAEVALGDLTAAADEFQKALDLVPEHPLALCNLTIVLAKQNRLHDAGALARRALKAAPESGAVRYILGMSMLVEKGDTDEALDNFERAADQIPKAHVAAGDLLARRGQRQEAIRHFEQYLRSAPANDKDRAAVDDRLEQLRR